MWLIRADDETFTLLQSKNVEKEGEDDTDVAVSILLNQSEVQLLMLREVSLIQCLDIVSNSCDQVGKFLLFDLLVHVEEHLLDSILQELSIWRSSQWENLCEYWVLLEVGLDHLWATEPVTSKKVVLQGDSDFWLVIWILIFVWELNVEFLSKWLVWMGLDRQGSSNGQHLEEEWNLGWILREFLEVLLAKESLGVVLEELLECDGLSIELLHEFLVTDAFLQCLIGAIDLDHRWSVWMTAHPVLSKRLLADIFTWVMLSVDLANE